MLRSDKQTTGSEAEAHSVAGDAGRLSIASIGAVVGTYGVFAGVCYAVAFWSSFDVNPLSYASLHDVAVLSLVPVVFGLLLTIMGALIGHALGNPFDAIRHLESQPKGSKFARPLAFLLRAIIFILLAAIAYRYGGAPLVSFGAASFAFCFLVGKSSIFRTHIKDDGTHSLVVYIVCMMPFSAALYGRMDSKRIIAGSDVLTVSSRHFSYKILNDFPFLVENPRFVGVLGNHYFFFNPHLNTLHAAPVAGLGALSIRRSGIR